jgi:pSer/pThr/pTyr-binding forkhead associated (FHA) protein
MVATKVVITVTGGSHCGTRFVVRGPGHSVVGRAADCPVRLAGAFEDGLVSRHHCQVDIEPPCVRVHDLGSRNGTFLNGKRIMRPESGPLSEYDTQTIPQEYELKDGDELQVGPIPLRVAIHMQREVQTDVDGRAAVR